MRPGQGDRQFDQPQGGRRRLSRPRPGDRPLRRRRRRDGIRRAGPGRHRRPEGRGAVQGIPTAHHARGLASVRHRLRSRGPGRRHGHRGAQRVRRRVHRGDAPPEGAVPAGPRQRRHQQPVVRLPRQRAGARGDALRLPVPRDPRRPRHGDRQRGPVGGLRGHPSRPARARRGPLVRSAAGRDRAPRAVRRRREGGNPEEGGGPGVAGRRRRGPALARARARRPRLPGGGPRGGPAAVPQAALDHRGPADGRDEAGRRPVRLRPHVPAPGGEERPGDEEGGVVPPALHGGRHVRRPAGPRPHPAGHRQGRRPRHRQEHRRRRARLQRLRGDRSRRDGAGRADSRRGRGPQGRHGRAERAHHPLARRDGLGGARDGTGRLQGPAPHRRRHDEPPAHGGEDRPGGTAARRPTWPTRRASRASPRG